MSFKISIKVKLLFYALCMTALTLHAQKRCDVIFINRAAGKVSGPIIIQRDPDTRLD